MTFYNNKRGANTRTPFYCYKRQQGNCKPQNKYTMFDYIYSKIGKISPAEILSNPELEFTTILNLTTGEIGYGNKERKHGGTRQPKNIKRAMMDGLTIKVTNNQHINLEGSLHEFAHGNNYGQFNVEDLHTAVRRIESTIGVPARNIRLHNLEFGVNVHLPFPVADFLDNILSYKGREPDRITYNGKGNMRKFTFERYEVKLYDKGLQYGLDRVNILRVELKVTRMIHVQGKTGIKTLSCLLRRENYPLLMDLLIEPVRDAIISENGLPMEGLNKYSRKLHKEGRSRRYWANLFKNNRRQYWKKSRQYKQLIEESGIVTMKGTVLEEISKTWDRLTNVRHDLTEQERDSLTDQVIRQDVGINTYTNQLIRTPNEVPPAMERRFCKTCGRDINDQKPGSVFCSERKYGREAKRCRNRDSNPRNNFLKRENRIYSRGLLFDVTPFLIRSSKPNGIVNYN